jgi:hypothetical protein
MALRVKHENAAGTTTGGWYPAQEPSASAVM